MLSTLDPDLYAVSKSVASLGSRANAISLGKVRGKRIPMTRRPTLSSERTSKTNGWVLLRRNPGGGVGVRTSMAIHLRFYSGASR